MPDTDLDAYCRLHEQRFVEELIEACRIPSISADPAYRAEVRRSAEYLAEAARGAGFPHAEILETGGHPAVYAERIVDPALPTALIYGHHDVQPVDPLDEWVTPPFEPVVRDGRLWCRGAVDDKGQVWMHLKAVEAHLQARGELPLNLKLIIEGEEEIGSVHFDALAVRERHRLACDVTVISDTGVFAKDVPSLTTRLRGLAAVEVEVRGPSLDLHSGVFGGAVTNPAEALAHILASLKNLETGRITVPGFYDAVEEPSGEEREQYASLPYDEAVFRRQAGGVSALAGEVGWTDQERRWVRPTLEINGIWGGYQGAGPKTIIPAVAGAKITCRLVPRMDPRTVSEQVATAVRAAAPPGVEVTVTIHPGGRPVVAPIDHPVVQAAARSMEHGFGIKPVFIAEGGSIPPVQTLQEQLGVPAILVGVGLPDDQFHAPNEHFDLDQFQAGIRVLAHLWDELAQTLRPPAQGAPGG